MITGVTEVTEVILARVTAVMAVTGGHDCNIGRGRGRGRVTDTVDVVTVTAITAITEVT